MKTALPLSLLALMAAGAVQAQAPLVVTSAADAGDGSLRAALSDASRAQMPMRILILTEDAITLETGLTYTGRMPLEIVGRGQTVQTEADETLLTASEGASLSIADLTLAGPGGFDIDNQSRTGGGKGLFIDIRDDQEGQVHLILDRVTVRDVSGHGIHVSDCSLADDCGAGAGGGGAGSDASIVASLSDVTVKNVGNGAFDRDGVRLDERGPGDIYATIRNGTFTDVGADGVEFDEGDAGNVIVTSYGSTYSENGGYCDPETFAAFLPDPAEAGFEQGQMAEADIPGPVTGSPDDACIEREVDLYDDGSVEAYAFGIDLDDGFDIDEAGEGTLDILVVGGVVAGNLDEGMDMDEDDAGDLIASYVGTRATGNTDDGYKHSEAGPGAVMGVVSDATASDNGGVGFVYEEEDAGDLEVQIRNAVATGNDDGETGFEFVQEGDGDGTLVLQGTDTSNGIETDGVMMAEE